MSHVFVLDTTKKPRAPVHPGEARRLLTQGKAAVFKRFPFTIILKVEVCNPQVQPLRIKLDPGSRTTGIAIVDDCTGEVVFAAELTHRGHKIKEALDSRRASRRSRRARHTRYRKPRFNNRTRPKGWLAPSLESRVHNVTTWVNRLARVCPIGAISMELVRFDLQAMEQPDIEGCQYQQGTLQGYELREYVLEKWNRTGAYCSKKEIPLQVEHIIPRAKGGSNRVSNLTLACAQCNLAKGTQEIVVFLKKKPEVFKRIQAQVKKPLKDAAAVNTTRWALYDQLKVLGLPVECGSGGLTKYNRCTRTLPKTHWLDAACVGKSTPLVLHVHRVAPLLITATGHGCRQMCLMDERGFPRTKPKQAKKVQGFQTGDIVRAVVTSGVKVGTYVGKVAIRATGSFNITTATRTIEGISHRFCTVLHHCDGYSYQRGKNVTVCGPSFIPPHAEKRRGIQKGKEMTKGSAKRKFGLNDMFPVSDTVTTTALSHAFPKVEEAVQSIIQDIGRTYGNISIESIIANPYQPRKTFDQQKLQELAASLHEDGMLEPILVRVSSQPAIYEIAAGERRWRAAKLAGWTVVPAEILETCSDAKMKRIALLENIQREQLTPMELAEIYEALLQEKDELGKSVYTIRSLADMLKKNKDHVDEHRALLRVPLDVRQLIEEDPDIPVRVIRELGNVEEQADRRYLIDEVRARNLKTADVIAILQQRKKLHLQHVTSVASPPSSPLGTEPSAPTIVVSSHEQQSPVLPSIISSPETVTVIEHERSIAKPPLQKPSSTLALVVLERKLHKEQAQLQKVVDRIMSEIPTMSHEEKALVRHYVEQWGSLLRRANEDIEAAASDLLDE